MPPTIDAFPHILPRELFERMCAAAETRLAQTWLNGSRRHAGLYDLDVRFRVMNQFPEYRQVLKLATPPIEQVASGTAARIFTNLDGHALDEPRFEPLFARLSALDGRRGGTNDPHIYRFFGVDHVLFATDWPFGPPTDEANIPPSLRILGELGLSSAELDMILGGNALRLLGLVD